MMIDPRNSHQDKDKFFMEVTTALIWKTWSYLEEDVPTLKRQCNHALTRYDVRTHQGQNAKT